MDSGSTNFYPTHCRSVSGEQGCEYCETREWKDGEEIRIYLGCEGNKKKWSDYECYVHNEGSMPDEATLANRINEEMRDPTENRKGKH